MRLRLHPSLIAAATAALGAVLFPIALSADDEPAENAGAKEEDKAATAPAGEEEKEEEDGVVARLFAEHETPASFTDALRAAREAGVSLQVITEAEMVRYLFRQTDMAGVRKILPRIEEVRATFDPGQSRVFDEKREFEAAAEYAQALIALTNGDEAALKAHITEAFWLNPEQARAFGQLVLGFRARNEATPTPEAEADEADTDEDAGESGEE